MRVKQKTPGTVKNLQLFTSDAQVDYHQNRRRHTNILTRLTTPDSNERGNPVTNQLKPWLPPTPKLISTWNGGPKASAGCR